MKDPQFGIAASLAGARRARRPSGCLTGCLTKLVLTLGAALVFVWAFTALLNPWALHIGGRSTPLLYWHGSGTLLSKDGKTYPLYVMFFPTRPGGTHGGGRREGKTVSARVGGTAWLCVSPGSMQKMNVSGTMYGGYASAEESLFDFRILEWRNPFAINPQRRGFFDIAGQFHGPDLVMDRPNEQGIPLKSGPFIDHATVTLRWGNYEDFEAVCRSEATRSGP
jgi:hypothetical protein